MARPEIRGRAAFLAILLALSGAALPARGAEPVAAAAAPAATTPAREQVESAKAAMRARDFATAWTRLEAPAAAGDTEAQYLLGCLLLADLVPSAGRPAASSYFESAAAHGNASAAYALAAIAASADPPDPDAARRWLNRAAELGDTFAREQLQQGTLPLASRPQDYLEDETLRRAALWRAAQRGDLMTVGALADPSRVDAADDFGRTALHHAAESGQDAAVQMLLARGAGRDTNDRYATTPLMLACAAESPAACSTLIAAGSPLEAQDREGNTALAYALRAGRAEQAAALKAAGARPVAGRTLAVSGDASDRLMRGNQDAYAGWPDVVVAATRRNPEKLKALLASGADPNAVVPGGSTALVAAVEAGATRSVPLLLDAGADPSRADARGRTPLEAAVALGDADTVVLLVQRAPRRACPHRNPPHWSGPPSCGATPPPCGHCLPVVRRPGCARRKARRPCCSPRHGATRRSPASCSRPACRSARPIRRAGPHCGSPPVPAPAA